MKIHHFLDTDTLFIELAHLVRSKSKKVSNNLILDFDEPGKSVDVALKYDSQISDSNTIENLLPIIPMLQTLQQRIAGPLRRGGVVGRGDGRYGRHLLHSLSALSTAV